MPSTWVLHRFRSAFLHENLTLFVLKLIEDSEKGEWDVLNSLYSQYKLTPNAREFRRLLESLVNGGYASFESTEGTRKLRITKTGTKLLSSLEGEYRAIVSNVGEAEVTGAATG